MVPVWNQVLSQIDYDVEYGRILNETIRKGNLNCPFPAHEDKKPSFQIRDDGGWKCYGCEESGSNPIDLEAKLLSTDFIKLARKRSQEINEKVRHSDILSEHGALLHNPALLDFLNLEKGWSSEWIRNLKLGLGNKGDRITIPIHDVYGNCITRAHYSHMGEEPKFYFDTDSGKPLSQIWPWKSLHNSNDLLMCEGYPDTITALSLGLPAITLGTAGNWSAEFLPYLEDKNLVLCYDGDVAGRCGVEKLIKELGAVPRSIRIIQMPDGEDLTSLLRQHAFSFEVFDQLQNEAETVHEEKIIQTYTTILDDEPKELTLKSMVDPVNYRQMGVVTATVTTVDDATTIIPRRLSMLCNDTTKPSGKCASCELFKCEGLQGQFEIFSDHPDIVRMATNKSREIDAIYRDVFDVNPRCNVITRITEAQPVQKFIMTESVDEQASKPSRQLGLFLGTGLEPNQTYRFKQYSTHHNINSMVMAVVINAEATGTQLDNFDTHLDMLPGLKSFQVEPKQTIEQKLSDIYHQTIHNITRIWDRPLLHVGADLVFFAVNEFRLDHEPVPRGCLDVLVFGDPRCGKGRVVEGLMNYYKFGEMLSGENTSFMNLVGGIDSNELFRGVRWGRFVANNRGVIIIDEISSLERETIGRLSRLRSEGIAEIDKFGSHAKASAKCSSIFIGNPRGLPIGERNFGVEAIGELIGKPEDVARLDYAIAVRNDDVDAETINRSVDRIPEKYLLEDHRNLILWCKTRSVNQVLFEPEAVKALHRYSKALGKQYDAEIPLIQAENVRIKLARISASVAGRLFSTDDGRTLSIRIEHVDFAHEFLQCVYHDEALAYAQYSAFRKTAWAGEDTVETVMAECFEDRTVPRKMLVGMLQMRQFTPADIEGLSGLYQTSARKLIGSLVQLNAIRRQGGSYVKTRKLVDFLRKELIGKSIIKKHQMMTVPEKMAEAATAPTKT